MTKVLSKAHLFDLKRKLAEIENLQSVARKFRDNLRVKRWRLVKAIETLEQMELDL